MATDDSDPEYRAWLEKLREVNEALRITEQVIAAARECFDDLRRGWQ